MNEDQTTDVVVAPSRQAERIFNLLAREFNLDAEDGSGPLPTEAVQIVADTLLVAGLIARAAGMDRNDVIAVSGGGYDVAESMMIGVTHGGGTA